MSLPSGFCIEEFIGVKIENMAISNCAEPRNAAVELLNGSEVIVDHLIVSNSTGLLVEDVVGSFSILNSIFMGSSRGTLHMDYSSCKLPTILNLIQQLNIHKQNVYLFVSNPCHLQNSSAY